MNVCMCVYVCTYVCMYVYMYVHMYVCTYVCMYVRMYVCLGCAIMEKAISQYKIISTTIIVSINNDTALCIILPFKIAL